MDTGLFYAINHGMENGLFNWLMPIITHYNYVFGLAIAAYLIWKDPKKGLVILAVVLIAVTVSDLINHRALKAFFMRPRPCNVLPDVHLITGCSGSFSFPSSHAVNAFTVAAVFGFFEKKLMYIAITAAALVAFSRVYVGVHYPADVTVGALVGAGLGYLAYRVSRVTVTKVLEGRE